MNIRWLWFDYVPPELGLSRKERRAIWRRSDALRPKDMELSANRRAFRWGCLLCAPACLLILGLVMATEFEWPVSRIVGRVVPPISLLSMWFGSAYASGKTQAPFVRRALRERGHDVCPDCGYLLRGLGKHITRCPECGWVREEMAT